MKKINLFLVLLISISFSCSNKNQKFIDKIKEQVKEDALGIEMNYKNINFEWVDTLFVNEKLIHLNNINDESLQTILDFEYFVKDNFETGKLFSKEYLSKNRILELRNWEVEVGHPNKYGSWVKDGYKDYLEFAFANRNASKYISELCNQIEQTDSLLNNYTQIDEGDITLLENILWYYKRIENYQSNNNPEEIWSNLTTILEEIRRNKSQIDSLSSLEPNQVIYYKSLNTFKINNPIFNGAEQELKQYFIFDTNFNIIERIDYKK